MRTRMVLQEAARIRTTPAYIAGVIDVSSVFSYLADIPVVVWYAITFAIKVALFILFRAPGARTFANAAPALMLLLLIYLFASVGNSLFLETFPNYFGFLFHLGSTLLLVASPKYFNYLKGIADTGVAIVVIYIPFALLGYTGEFYGRYLFFGGTHPNLGAEIIAATTIVATCVYPKKLALTILVFAYMAVSLMQGRAAMAAIILSFIIMNRDYIRHFLKSNSGIITGFLVITTLIATYMFYSESINNFFINAFLLFDENRGVGTGLVGRLERWEISLDLFLQNPILGMGFNYFAVNNLLSPHNAFLYALAEFGMFSFVIIFLLFLGYRKIYLEVKNVAISFIPFGVLLIFNDRFIDLSIYPFVIFTTLFIAFSFKGRRVPAIHKLTFLRKEQNRVEFS